MGDGGVMVIAEDTSQRTKPDYTCTDTRHGVGRRCHPDVPPAPEGHQFRVLAGEVTRQRVRGNSTGGLVRSATQAWSAYQRRARRLRRGSAAAQLGVMRCGRNPDCRRGLAC